MLIELHSPNENTTQALAAALAAECRAGDCILLMGELGSGKTAFARGFIRALAGEEEVPSPTFTLLQIYEGNDVSIAHFDLYRLKRPEEADELGLDEALERGIVLIEWPELIAARLPANALTVRLAYGSQPATRQLGVSGGEAWSGRLERIREEMNERKAGAD